MHRPGRAVPQTFSSMTFLFYIINNNNKKDKSVVKLAFSCLHGRRDRHSVGKHKRAWQAAGHFVGYHGCRAQLHTDTHRQHPGSHHGSGDRIPSSPKQAFCLWEDAPELCQQCLEQYDKPQIHAMRTVRSPSKKMQKNTSPSISAHTNLHPPGRPQSCRPRH